MPRGQYDRTRTAVASEDLTPRAAEYRRERRRRDDGAIDRIYRENLTIPPHIKRKLDAEGMTARWVFDDPGRVSQLEAEDWDKVPDCEPINANKSTGEKLILMAKRQDWFDEDQRRRTEARTKGSPASPAPANGLDVIANRIEHSR